MASGATGCQRLGRSGRKAEENAAVRVRSARRSGLLNREMGQLTGNRRARACTIFGSSTGRGCLSLRTKSSGLQVSIRHASRFPPRASVRSPGAGNLAEREIAELVDANGGGLRGERGAGASSEASAG